MELLFLPGEAITHQIVDRPVGSFEVRPGHGRSAVFDRALTSTISFYGEFEWICLDLQRIKIDCSLHFRSKAGSLSSLNGSSIRST